MYWCCILFWLWLDLFLLLLEIICSVCVLIILWVFVYCGYWVMKLYGKRCIVYLERFFLLVDCWFLLVFFYQMDISLLLCGVVLFCVWWFFICICIWCIKKKWICKYIKKFGEYIGFFFDNILVVMLLFVLCWLLGINIV